MLSKHGRARRSQAPLTRAEDVVLTKTTVSMCNCVSMTLGNAQKLTLDAQFFHMDPYRGTSLR